MNHRFGAPDGKWAKVEIMGHVEHIARCLEVPMLDGKALRVCDEIEGSPILYGSSAIFSIRWLTEEEGERESDRRHAEHVETGKRHARGKIIGGLQQKIRDVVGSLKMSKADIFHEVRAQLPDVNDDDLVEAFDGSWLTITPENETLWWLDPEDCPL
jgi:hypothetical protein